jgi:hypothetical protein
MNPSISFEPADLSGLGEGGSGAEKIVIDDMKVDQITKEYLHRVVAPVFATIENPKLKGFCCLFFYYWYELFNNKKLVVTEHEPGLKQFLGIMSRISFSELYDSLDTGEKAELRTILDAIVGDNGADFRLKAYKGYDSSGRHVLIQPKLTLADWYRSIVGGRSSRPSGADCLSPPNMLGRDSMGAFVLEKSEGLPLIEVRGYASLEASDRPLIISIVREFIEIEANWFFGKEGK